MTGRLWHARLRLRVLSGVLLVGVLGLTAAGFVVSRNVVSDQEHRLLKQRADEASLYLSTAISSVQTELASLAATAAATREQPRAFAASTKLLTSVPGGFTAVALVRTAPTLHVVAATGTILTGGLGAVRTQAVRQAVARVALTGSLVATPLFGTGPSRSLGFAYASPSLPDAVVYAESSVKPSASTSTTSSQPFSELVAAVYAAPTERTDQLIAATGKAGGLPLRGDTVAVRAPIGQGQPWLLVARARHPLVGSAATAMPWAILGAGIIAAVLATAIVETLARRREYAVALVADRTRELERSLTDLAAAHEQLVRQERLAAIGQLASTIGHELRNPLGVISNAVYLLRQDFGAQPPDAAQRHLATAEREVSAATVIVSDLLEFARQRQPVMADVDCVELADEVLSILPPPNGVTVQRDVATRPVTVRADRDMLRQVLLNLVGNGYQAMPDGGTLTVRVQPLDGAVRVGVADTGSGISDETRGHLFEPFFTTKARGVGLGLAVTKRIVESHQGDITVDSEPGRGAEFRVTLPAIAAPRAAQPSDTRIGADR